MDRRLELHEYLMEILGNKNVYFQPPVSVQLLYPCVIYSVGNGDIKRADNSVYTYTNSYEIMFIYKKPNMDILEQMLRSFSMCSVSRVYVADNLNHYVFNVYY